MKKDNLMSNSPPSNEPKRKESFKEKFKSSLQDLQSNERFSNMVGYATSNTRDTISYIALIIGIVLLFFQPFYGAALVGFIVGLYFSSEILAFIKNLSLLVDDQGVVRSLIAGGFVLAIFILVPAIFIGLALAVAVRQILFPAP